MCKVCNILIYVCKGENIHDNFLYEFWKNMLIIREVLFSSMVMVLFFCVKEPLELVLVL